MHEGFPMLSDLSGGSGIHEVFQLEEFFVEMVDGCRLTVCILFMQDKVVILEQQHYSETAERNQLEKIRKIAECVGKDRVVIKLHPRSPVDKYGDEFACINTKMPFEIIAMNEDISNMTFITEGSSAVVNFALMLHVEPTVFLLRNIGRKRYIPKGGTDLLFKIVQDSYSKGNFYTPFTEEEFYQQLQQIGKK